MANTNLLTIEELTVKYCNNLEKFTDGIDLSFKDISATSKILVELYEAERTLGKLHELNKTHEVIDHTTGKVLGDLYDNEKIGDIMLIANINVGFQIDACENFIRLLTRNQLIF